MLSNYIFDVFSYGFALTCDNTDKSSYAFVIDMLWTCYKLWPNNNFIDSPFYTIGSSLASESVDLYAKVMEELDQVVTRMVFENYGIEKYHDDHTQSTVSNLRFTKYKDKTNTTILHQNHVKGL